MIFVTGTKRSGTSMWMQLLRAAGFEVIGEAFPKDWDAAIKPANPEGFYESDFRNGVYYRTNPNAQTGVYLSPNETRDTVVKVFIPGVVRSDLAFVDKVVVTVRNWREYPGSLTRLYEMEQEFRSPKLPPGVPPPKHVPPVLEWWAENYALLSDVLTRRYPVHFVAYETVLSRPEETLREVLDWLGGGDAALAVAAVKPHLRTQSASPAPSTPQHDLDPNHAQVFDDLCARIRDRRGLDASFIDELNRVGQELQPAVRAASEEAARHRMLRRRLLRQAKEASDATGE